MLTLRGTLAAPIRSYRRPWRRGDDFSARPKWFQLLEPWPGLPLDPPYDPKCVVSLEAILAIPSEARGIQRSGHPAHDGRTDGRVRSELTGGVSAAEAHEGICPEKDSGRLPNLPRDEICHFLHFSRYVENFAVKRVGD